MMSKSDQRMSIPFSSPARNECVDTPLGHEQRSGAEAPRLGTVYRGAKAPRFHRPCASVDAAGESMRNGSLRSRYTVPSTYR